MKEIIDLYDVNREHTGLTAVRGEKLPEGTYRMVVHVCTFRKKKLLKQDGQRERK